MQQRLVIYLFLICVVCSFILFTFPVVFGPDSYQYWSDRYHYTLTNKYLFAKVPSESWFGPLWRDDTLCGNIWLSSLVTTPIAADIVLARLAGLSPMGIELVANLVLYFVAVFSMYWFIREVLMLSMESATVVAVLFATTANWISIVAAAPELPMAVAWLPALLCLAHKLCVESERGIGVRAVLLIVGLGLAFYGCSINSTPATLPITPVLVLAYVGVVFRSFRALVIAAVSLSIGILLYAPYLWAFVEAGSISHRNMAPAFYEHESLDVRKAVEWVYWIFQQLAVGVNGHGVYLIVLLGIALWMCRGPRLRTEQPQLRRAIGFAVGTLFFIVLFSWFHDFFNDLKQSIPVLRGWDVKRFLVFSFFFTLTLFAWIFDRAFFQNEALSSVTRSRLTRSVLVVVAVVAVLQVSRSWWWRYSEVPSAIYPQNLVLYAYFFLYIAGTFLLIWWLYRDAREGRAIPWCGTPSGRMWCTILIVLSACFITSVHGYQSGLLDPREPRKPFPYLTYAERYQIPQDISFIKEHGRPIGRVADVTRPLTETSWTSASDITLLPLDGLRTLSGYSTLYPAWYGNLISRGVNGRQRSAWNIVQLEDTDSINFEVLPLLDVSHVIAMRKVTMPHYAELIQFESSERTLYRITKESHIGPAFLSTDFHCYRNDEEALESIHRAELRGLLAKAVLVSKDLESLALCAGRQKLLSTDWGTPSISSNRAPDSINIEVKNSPGGILTLSDTYYPGWRAFVNGEERPILRTYVALRGVLIAPGHQTVQFVYDPQPFGFLLYLSGVLLCGLVIVGLGLSGWERVISRRQTRE